MGSTPRNGWSTSTSSAASYYQHSQPPALLLLVYPFTLLLGSLYRAISPTARVRHDAADPALAPTIASDINLSQSSQYSHSRSDSGSPVNYFARKDNIFNVYFVKIGWFWTTLAFLTLLLTQPAYTNAGPLRARRTLQALSRYATVTLSWILTTQWFFGPALVDRSFVITGGRCEDAHVQVRPPTEKVPGHAQHPVSELGAILTAAACKAAGGAWRGGHDVSGHVFMLVLASAFLAFETWGAVAPEGAVGVAGEEKKQDDSDGGQHRDDDLSGTGTEGCWLRIWARRFVWTVTGLSWWMLFMTAIWFHTWLERVSCITHGLPFFVGLADRRTTLGIRSAHRSGHCVYHLLSSEDACLVEKHHWASGGIGTRLLP